MNRYALNCDLHLIYFLHALPIDVTHRCIINLVLLFQESSSNVSINNNYKSNSNSSINTNGRYQLSIYFLLLCYEHRLSSTLHNIDTTIPLYLVPYEDYDAIITAATANSTAMYLNPPALDIFLSAKSSSSSSSSSSLLLLQRIQQLTHTLITKRIKLIAIDHAIGLFTFIYHMLLMNWNSWSSTDDLEQIVDDCSSYQRQVMRSTEVR